MLRNILKSNHQTLFWGKGREGQKGRRGIMCVCQCLTSFYYNFYSSSDVVLQEVNGMYVYVIVNFWHNKNFEHCILCVDVF